MEGVINKCLWGVTREYTQTVKGVIDIQVKFNPLNNLICGQHYCSKGYNANEPLTKEIEV